MKKINNGKLKNLSSDNSAQIKKSKHKVKVQIFVQVY